MGRGHDESRRLVVRHFESTVAIEDFDDAEGEKRIEVWSEIYLKTEREIVSLLRRFGVEVMLIVLNVSGSKGKTTEDDVMLRPVSEADDEATQLAIQCPQKQCLELLE